MKRARSWLLLCVVVLATAGCGSEFGAGAAAGTGVGALLQNTITGAKKDLEAREQQLIAAYNEGVAIGMKQEDLDSIKKEIERIRLGRQGVEVGEGLLGLDWKDPKETSGALAALIELGLLVWGGKKLSSTTKKLTATNEGVAKFQGTNSPEIAGQLYDTIKEKLLKNGIG